MERSVGKTELLPCPFCGGQAELQNNGSIWCENAGNTERCCNATMLYPAGYMANTPKEITKDIKKRSIAAWNKRTPAVPALIQMVEARDKVLEEAKKILRFQGDHTSVIDCRRSAKLGLARINKIREADNA